MQELDQNMITALRQALEATDRVAYDNVTHDNNGYSILDHEGRFVPGKHPRGGPFGAALAIATPSGGLEIIGEMRGNNVVGSGIASTHAEHEAMRPDNVEKLINRLVIHQQNGEDPTVWMISSGQSCTTCHTKQEILARDLVTKGLIKAGQFKTLFGATYDETFDIAQFNDAPYADAMVFEARFPGHTHGLIQHRIQPLAEVPETVREQLNLNNAALAMIVRDGQIYATGTDTRQPYDLFATPEANAVRAACQRFRREGQFASWEIDGTLYTTTYEVGPLLFAEAGWTGIRQVVTVVMPQGQREKQFQNFEAFGLSNRRFLEVVAGGYLQPEAAIKVFRDMDFVNRAQPKWAEMLKTNGIALYNGSAVDPEVERATRDSRTAWRFGASPLAPGVEPGCKLPARPLQPLACACHSGPPRLMAV